MSCVFLSCVLLTVCVDSMVCFVHVYNCRVVLRNAVHYGRAILLPGRVSIHSSLQLADSTFSLFAHCHHARLVRPSVPFDFICKYRCGSWRETVAVIALTRHACVFGVFVQKPAYSRPLSRMTAGLVARCERKRLLGRRN